jgi:pSer/pThr/pTyr-binding forkhead associated (FHA) protein
MLIVRQGKESDQAFEVRKDRMTIGRSSESDIALEDEAVSRVHAVVLRDEDGTYRICDRNSANGTYVNSQRISEYVLEDGDEIQVGLMVLEFRQSEP